MTRDGGQGEGGGGRYYQYRVGKEAVRKGVGVGWTVGVVLLLF